MYKVLVEDYISIVDDKDNEVLHIELDNNMDDVVDEFNRFIVIINRKL